MLFVNFLSSDIGKLSTFCTRFPVPALFRSLIWKLVLGKWITFIVLGGGGGGVQGIIYLVSHHNLLCIFYMTAIQDIICGLAVFLHRSVQNLV